MLGSPQDAELHRLAERTLQDGRDLVWALDGLAVDGLDDVLGLEACGARWGRGIACGAGRR